MTEPVFDVGIVGGGVVGAALAAALARENLKVVLLEKGEGPRAWTPERYDPRVFAISPGSVRFLESIRAWPYIVERRASAYARMQVWEREPEQGLVFDAADARVRELGFIVEHDLLLEGVWHALGEARALRAVEVVSLGFEREQVQLQLGDGRQLRVRVVVAADGADSPLRRMAEVETVSWSYAQKAIVCHVNTERPHRQTAWQRFLPTGPLAFLPLADGRSSIVWSTTEAEELLALDDAAFKARLAAASQYALGAIIECSERLAFPLRLLHATEYVRARLALVGDSAHVVHPLAGQGVNLGFADAQALVRELVMAVGAGRDPGSLRVLQRYARARKADNLDMLAVTDGLYRLFGLPLPGLEPLLAAGMNLVNRVAPAKRQLMRRALGLD